MVLRVLVAVVAVVAVVALATGCTRDSIYGPPTQSACPDGGTTLTYDNFAKPFMTAYCVACHDSNKVGKDRQGAPSFHDFDTLFGIKAVHEHIDETTAAGPAAINDGMPEATPKPTVAERYQLGEWLACGLP
ncbi:MAG: hypothetical protein NT062_27650 [Proteobacteria bacterium]|nr:hypothetical protein [Pseudomonadota bacterium]